MRYGLRALYCLLVERALILILIVAPAHTPVVWALDRETVQSPPAPSPDPAATFKWADLGLKGDLTYKNFPHFFETANDDRNFRNEGILHLELARKLSDWARFKILGEAREDDGRFTQGVRTRIPDAMLRRRYLDIKEMAVEFNSTSVDLTVGKLVYAWGAADTYNPTDNINPYDYLDVIDREKMAVYSANLKVATGPATVDFVLTPVFTPSRDPLAKSRWTPAPIPATGTTIGGIGDIIPAGTTVEERRIPGRNLNNMQYAVRAKTTAAGWDIAASYFNGFEYVPVIKRERNALGGETFVPVYRHMQAPGLGFSTTIDKFVFNGDFALKFEDRDIKDSRFQGSIGLNYTWDDLGLKGLEHIMFIVEHNREQFLSAKNPGFIADGNFINGFRNALSGRMQIKFNEETQFSVGGTMDFMKEANYYLQIKLNHKFTDDLHIETGFDNFAGVNNSFWGKWHDNDRFFLFLKRYF